MEYLDLIEQQLELLFPSTNAVFEAARYSLFSGGKRLRPFLTLATAEIFGTSYLEKAIIPACALEMIHTYSLIHDDLPCMDDDDFRRGKPTLHKVFGEGHAVLTGDFLLTYAFQLLSESPSLSDQQKITLIQRVSQSAGEKGMIGGQVIDIASQDKEISWEMLLHMHRGKTAALITASIECGGIVGGANKEEMLLLTRIGKDLGLAFQIVDDILDAEKETHLMTNATSHLGREGAQAYADSLFDSAHSALSSLPYPTSRLQNLAHTLIYRTH